MAQAKNDTQNVSSAKGVKGGYFFSAPIGTKVPTDYSSELDEAFVNLGYILEDGFVITEEQDSNEVKDINGDTVDELSSSRTESVKVTLLETKLETLQEVRGHKNVTDEDGTITVKHNSEPRDYRVYVLELLLKNNRKSRVVIPNGKIVEIGDITYASGEPLSYEVNIKCFVDENADTMLEYIQSNATKATAMAASQPVKVSK